ncbi:hypothetical protein H257_08808 [Aphanomyces astaci]|uniref:C3H1-type domain-containing protein n=2 Tax=Aphanomyces astaci TaxID=112090 RepID=W4GCG0_APHAT|nr:hypothetical protein H257_08808 [Aphanomyces astaci]ETV77377.1 hypothetical protein H257_08808 [Aphanomyces astaci]RQM12756.1 hypothetical protein B5M09_004113 [Aphanomyces astaci]|eukprot:XP_009833164.1 hypothetical protein H257_08808 [Aphanomyces astaci]
MLVTAMDHIHQSRRLNLGLMSSHAADADSEYLDLANHNMHASAPSTYHLSLQHSHSLDMNAQYLDQDGLQDDQYTLGGQLSSPKNNAKPSLYKTELCKRFSEYGSCRYGAKCQFAHGLPELRHVLRHPKYKTTKCKSYWGSGHCPYGSRCRFIHEEEVYNPNVKNSFRGGITQENELSPTGQGGPSFLNSSGYAPDFSPTSTDMGPGMYNPDFSHGPSSPQSWLGDASRSNFIRSSPSDMYPTKPNPIGPKKSPMAGASHHHTNDLDHGAEYSGLQDAIKVLMNFNYEESTPMAPASSPTGTSPSLSIKSPLARGDMSLHADELWKDFSAASISDAADDASAPSSSSDQKWFSNEHPPKQPPPPSNSASASLPPQFDTIDSRDDISRLSFFTKFK